MDDNLSTEIETCRALLPFLPLSHPSRPPILAALASALLYRHKPSEQEYGLLAALTLLTEALLLPLDPAAARLSPTTAMFYELACSLGSLFMLRHHLEDLEHALKYLRYILTLPPRALGDIDILRVAHVLTGLLGVWTEAVTEVQSDVADEVVQILQMAFATDPSSHYMEYITENAGRVLICILLESKQRSEKEYILEVFGEIEKMCPADRFPAFYIFHGIAHCKYFCQTRQYGHFRQAMVRLSEGLAHLPPEHNLRPGTQLSISEALAIRSEQDGDLTSLEEAIHHARAALDTCPPGHLTRPECPICLSFLLKQRYILFGNAEFLREADSYSQEVLSQELPEHPHVGREFLVEPSATFILRFRRDDSLAVLAEQIRLQQGQLNVIPMGHSDRLFVLHNLAIYYGAKFGRTRAMTDLNEEIHYHTLAVAAAPLDHHVRRMSLICLGSAFQMQCALDDIDGQSFRYIELSIECCRNALEMCPRGQMSRCKALQTLALSLSLRSLFFHREGDLEESMALFQSALDEEYADLHTRFAIADQWAGCARMHQHPLAALAYERAISLMQSSLTVGPTLEARHWRLKVTWGWPISALPLNYASYRIEMGSLERAIEILERGRAILWSEMRGLRTPMDQLRASEHAMLAERFVAISSELDNIATSAQPSSETKPADAPGSGRIDAFGQMMKNVRRLEQERGEIIDQIRHLPGFEHFLKAIPFKTLQTAAAYGPVVIVNHCMFRSDILIVLKDSAPVLIPTAKDFYTRATKLKQSLLETRTKYSLDSDHYQDALRDVLEVLYELVGRPVIEELHKLGIPEQSRVWWCPTSAFCSLPLHAAGPIGPEDGAKRYFSDIYISSYTPTLSALIEARKGIADMPLLERPSLLIVGQPDETLPGVRGEIRVIQRLVPSASSLIGAKATRTSVMKHLPEHRMVHFACHGTLNPERPFDAAFLFRGEERLKLLDTARSRLATAEFAFLSVCHAAEWTDRQAPDEALHLTAAMQYCGFQSVVGTLWAMADTDGQDLSKHFYGHMFAESEQGVRIGDRSAVALRDAVQRLRRKKGVTFERWVNFVHYGA